MQTTAVDAVGAKKHERLSSSDTETGFLRPSTQLRPSRCRKAKQKVISECKVNRVGANAAKIHELHKRNILRYLKNLSDVEAAGESVLCVV